MKLSETTPNDFWHVPRMWEGGDCWIIGGGASVPRLFGVPGDVISKVEKKEIPLSSYSDYLLPLHNKNVIGVNLAFLLGDWVSVMYFCDAQIFKLYKSLIFQFHNLKVTCASAFTNQRSEMGNIKILKRDNRPGLSLRDDTICWNQNSGAAAINFAILAGAKRILLLGFDMKPIPNGKTTHWVNGVHSTLYQRPSSPMVFKSFLKRYPYIARDAKQAKVEILNVNPDSALLDFPRVSLQEVL